MNHESTQVPKEDTQVVEEKLERLTQEASQLINTANKEEREALREYTISLLHGETETSQTDRRVSGDATRKAPFNPLALVLPLALAGEILFFLFPALGIVLLSAAAIAVLWGASCDRCCIAKYESEYDEARHKRRRALSR